MDRKEFAQILNNTVVPEGTDNNTCQGIIRPLCSALIEMMPGSLFRYRNCSELNFDAFDKDLIFTVTADKFNDPYDTLLGYNIDSIFKQIDIYSSKEFLLLLKEALLNGLEFPQNIVQCLGEANLTQLREQIISCDNFDNLCTNDFNDIMKMFCLINAKQLESTLKHVSTIACFSEDIHSVTMWSHYAQNHEGFALEYNMVPLLTEGDNRILPVIYGDERYDSSALFAWCIAKAIGLDVKNPDEFAHYKLMLHKATEWAYEKEWRVIQKQTDGLNQSKVSSFEMKPIAIYYGNRISPINKKLLHMLAQKKGINEYDMIIDPASPKYEVKYDQYINGSES